MRKGLKRALALVGALVLTFSVTATAFAASKDPITLDGGEEGASKMIGTFTGPGSRGEVTDAYKYLGFVSFLDLADKDYRYLQFTYTGNITQFRIQFVHDAGKSSEEIDSMKYWFNSEVVEDSENKAIKAKDGAAIPLEGNNTTVVIDLKASGIDMSYYNSGFHMHCDLMKQYGEFTISSAQLLADDGSSTEVQTTKGSASENSGESQPASTPNAAPKTGSATYPVVLGFSGIILACAGFAVSRRFKEEN